MMATNLQKQRVAIGSDAHLAVEVEGSGEPVLLIAGATGTINGRVADGDRVLTVAKALAIRRYPRPAIDVNARDLA